MRICSSIRSAKRCGYGANSIRAPKAAFLRLRDDLAHTPGAADNFMKAIRSVYEFAREQGLVEENPATGIKKINTNPKGGAIPWSSDELKAFRQTHPKGTTAHLWLTLQAFTACRIGDVVLFGREHETVRDGILWLDWQPGKKGSAPMSVPILPPLAEAIKAQTVVGPTYLLTSHGKPFSSPESLRNRIRKWCDTAGIERRTSHGIRKATAAVLAEMGCSQHQIMAMLAHTRAQTSEIYTRSAQRRVLAKEASELLATLKW